MVLHIDAMLGGFACADEYDRNVPAVTRFEKGVVFDTHFMEHSAEFAEERCDDRLRFFAKMASRTRVESHLARPRCSQPHVLRMLLHGLGLEYFWNGPAY